VSRLANWLRSLLALPVPGAIVGYVGFRVYRREAHVTTIAIHPTWRGHGLGELLFSETMERTLQIGVQRVTLEVRPSNPAAQQLYQKYGFQFTGTRKGYYSDGEDARLMAADVRSNGYRGRLRMLRLSLDDRLAADGIRVGQVSGDSV
jgi:ribosomal-protein-alanine N-acetyltransferase